MQIEVYILRSVTKGLNGKIERTSYDFWFDTGLPTSVLHHQIPFWTYGYKKKTGWKSVLRYAIWKGIIVEHQPAEIPRFIKLRGCTDRVDLEELKKIIKGRTV